MSNEKTIFGRWSGYEDLRGDWFTANYNYETKQYDLPEIPESFPKEEEILFASYGGGSYEGDATVIWRRGGKLYETHGGHCSCYGLEGQFEPEETTLEALALRGRKEPGTYYYFLSDHDGEAYTAYWTLIERLLADNA